MINKQSIWLLTLFSLILVLSVYYITMPSDFLEAANSETKKNTEKVTVTEQNETISALKVENNEERNKKITYKLRIPQTKQINSLCVVKIGNEYHKVYNAYHFTNKDGFKQTELTLEKYPRVKLEGDL